MNWALFLDDERFPVDSALPENCEYWMIARNHQDVIDLIAANGMPQFVSFDHDLGDISNGDGYIVAKYLCDLDMDTKYKFPQGFAYFVHSQNPIGSTNIKGYLDNYLRVRNG